MCQELTTLQSGFPAVHGLNEAIFFREVTSHNILHDLIRVDALLSCALCEPGLQVGSELHFHAFNIR